MPRMGGGDSPFGVAIAIVLAVGLLYKVHYLLSYSNASPYYDLAQMDSGIYVEWARSINRDGWMGDEVFYQAPLYPYLLNIIFRVFGDGFLSVYIIQLLMGLGIISLTHVIGKRIYSARAGSIAALLCLGYAPFTMFETKILTTTTEVFLCLLSMYFLVRAEDEGKGVYWVAGAAVLGFAIICRPNYALVVPIMITVLHLRNRRRIREVLFGILAVGLIPCVMVGVLTLRNYHVGGDFVPISSSGGVTFAQGNNAMARGAMVVLPGFSGTPANQRLEEKQIAEREVGRSLKPSEVSAFWFCWALGFI